MVQTAERRRAYHAAYYAAHADELKAQSSAYHAEHRAEILGKRAVYRANRKELIRVESAEYRATLDKEAVKKYLAQYYVNHRSRLLAQGAKYRATHQEQVQDNRRKWQAAHPEHSQLKKAARRARKLSAERADLTTAQWSAIKQLYGFRCVYCGASPKRLTQDHIIPLSKGGNHTVSNVVPACHSCNSRKWANPPLVPVQPALLV